MFFISGFLQPFFQVDVELCVPSVTINPSLDDIQSAIDKCAVEIIRSTQQIASWKSKIAFNRENEEDLTEMQQRRPTFHARIANDIEMVKNVLILTGAVQTLRNRVRESEL